MLPLPALDVTDLTARVAIFEGYSDNVVELVPAPGAAGERRGSPFTGLDVGLKRTDVGPHSERTLSLDVRGEHYTPLGPPVGGDDGALLVGYRAGWETDPTTTLAAGESVLFGDQNALRLTDLPLVAVDPSGGRRVFAFSMTDLTLARDLGAKDRVRVDLGDDLRATARDTTPGSAGPGVDYVAPRLENAWVRELGPNDSLETKLLLRYYYLAHLPVVLGAADGPRSTWQATPTGMLSHAVSEAWRVNALAGVSASTSAESGQGGLLLTPTVGAQALYAEENTLVTLTYGFGYVPVSPALGPGISNNVNVQASGPLGRTGAASKLVVLASAGAGRSAIPLTPESSFVVLDAGAGVSARYALGTWLGVMLGYEGRYSRYGVSDGSSSATVFFRDVVYAGVSGSFSTSPTEPGLELPHAPSRGQ